MRRASLLAVATLPLLGLAACIPQVDRPAGYGRPAPDRRPQRPYRDPPVQHYDPPPRQDEPVPQDRSDDRSGRDTGAVTTLPAPRPAWEARPVRADAKTIPDTTYVVQPGDTLSRVADRSGASLEAIARANDLESPYTIETGERLRIPGGRYHQVRRGETGIAIARAYGVEWSRIVTANALVEPYVLRADQRVLIPDAPGTVPALYRHPSESWDIPVRAPTSASQRSQLPLGRRR